MEFAEVRHLKRESIVEFFNSNITQGLHAFRGLSNGLKGALIEFAVAAVREKCRIRNLCILDIGSGRAGDIYKWIRLRPNKIVGLDISPDSITEAERRFRTVVQRGRASTPIEFHCMDCAKNNFPIEDSSMSIVSAQFSLQFFLDCVESIRHIVSESYRVLLPGGIFVACFPDGDRLAYEMSTAMPGIVSHVIGHFLFRQFEDTLGKLGTDPPTGIAYTFALGNSPQCSEYIIYHKYLEHIFSSLGFEGALRDGTFSSDAQRFYQEYDTVQKTVSKLLSGRWCSGQDWETLLTFRVFVARKKIEEEIASTNQKPQKDRKRKRPVSDKTGVQ